MARKRAPQIELDEAEDVRVPSDAAAVDEPKTDPAGGAARKTRKPRRNAAGKAAGKGRGKKAARAKKAPPAQATPVAEVPEAMVDAGHEPPANATPAAEIPEATVDSGDEPPAQATPAAEVSEATVEAGHEPPANATSAAEVPEATVDAGHEPPANATLADRPAAAPGPPDERVEVSAEAVELSPEEALKLLAWLGGPEADGGEGAGTAPDAPAGQGGPRARPFAPLTTCGAPSLPDRRLAREAGEEASGIAQGEGREAAAGPRSEWSCQMSGPRPPVGPEPAGEAAGPGGEAPLSGEVGFLASILGASCRLLTFEGAGVDDGMRVAQAAVTRLRDYVREGGLAVSIGPICRTLAEFVAEWDNTPPAMPVAIVANMSCAGAFLPAIVDERPRVASAYWIVFETLRSEVSTATSDFLAELRLRNRLRAIGFGPRNMMSAARGGAEAVRGHVEWGFGKGPIPAAS